MCHRLPDKELGLEPESLTVSVVAARNAKIVMILASVKKRAKPRFLATDRVMECD